MEFIDFLPNWIMTDAQPMANDTESATGIEMVAKVYGKTNEIVKTVNKFIADMETHIAEFETSTEANFEDFKTALRQEFQDFINIVELEMANGNASATNALAVANEAKDASAEALNNANEAKKESVNATASATNALAVANEAKDASAEAVFKMLKINVEAETDEVLINIPNRDGINEIIVEVITPCVYNGLSMKSGYSIGYIPEEDTTARYAFSRVTFDDESATKCYIRANLYKGSVWSANDAYATSDSTTKSITNSSNAITTLEMRKNLHALYLRDQSYGNDSPSKITAGTQITVRYR